MKISEFIEELNEIMENCGDIEVRVNDNEGFLCRADVTVDQAGTFTNSFPRMKDGEMYVRVWEE